MSSNWPNRPALKNTWQDGEDQKTQEESLASLHLQTLLVSFSVSVLYLSVSELVLGVVDVQRAQQLLHSFPAVHIRVVWNRRRIQDAITEREKYNII